MNVLLYSATYVNLWNNSENFKTVNFDAVHVDSRLL